MGNQRQVSREEYERLNAAAARAKQDGRFDIVEPDTDSASLAAMGATYQIGNIQVPQMGLDTVVLLSIAGVSLDEHDDDKSDAEQMRDIAMALYIIANGSEACHMLMGVKQRLKALERLEGLAKKSPDMFDRYMNKIDEIGGTAFAEVEARAIAFLGSIEGATLDDIASTIGMMAEDFSVVMGLLPDSMSDKKK